MSLSTTYEECLFTGTLENASRIEVIRSGLCSWLPLTIIQMVLMYAKHEGIQRLKKILQNETISVSPGYTYMELYVRLSKRNHWFVHVCGKRYSCIQPVQIHSEYVFIGNLWNFLCNQKYTTWHHEFERLFYRHNDWLFDLLKQKLRHYLLSRFISND